MKQHLTLELAGLVLIALAGFACDEGSAPPESDDDGAVLADATAPPDTGEIAPDTGEIAPDTGEIAPDGGPGADLGPPEALTINSVIPSRGIAAGATPVRIVGTGFVADLEIYLGDAICADVAVESPNLARCTTPPGAVGEVDVTAIALHPDETGELREVQSILPAGFTYFDGVSLSAVAPNRSPRRGGIRLVLTGTGLIESTQVMVDGQSATEVTARPDGSLTALAPAHDPGPADVSVVNYTGEATLPGALFYYEDLVVERAEPAFGPLNGGNEVILVGTGMGRETRAIFGERAAEVLAASADRTRLTLNAPAANATGPVDLQVENDNGEATLRGGYVYFDPEVDAFEVVGLAPAAGPVEGGNEVAVVGSGFTAETRVEVDGRPVACERGDAHHLVCTMPPNPEGSVDVIVRRGGDSIEIADGYHYFNRLELIAIEPDRGAIAGGTMVTLTGTGLSAGVEIELGGQPLDQIRVIDAFTVVGVTPESNPGPVDVRASTEFSRAVIPAGFTYFDPFSQFGGVWGEPIEGAVNITTRDASTGEILTEVAVITVSEVDGFRLEGITNDQGQITVSDVALQAPVKVTAAKEGYEVTTVEDVLVENVTIFLLPNDGEGAPPPGVAPAILSGIATGLDELPKPNRDRFVNVIFIETTHTTPYNRGRLPPPGPYQLPPLREKRATGATFQAGCCARTAPSRSSRALASWRSWAPSASSIGRSSSSGRTERRTTGACAPT